MLRTKRSLAQSLKSLLMKRKFSQITITDITNGCNLNRQTFYYHFQDIYDLLEWMFYDEIDQLIPDDAGQVNSREILMSVYDYLYDNRKIVGNLVKSVDTNVLLLTFQKRVNPLLYSYLSKKFGADKNEKDLEFLADIYSSVLGGSIINWTNKDCKEDYKENVTRLAKLCDSMTVESLVNYFG